MAGLFALAERVLGARLVERHDVPTWHPDVQFFDVYDVNAPDAPARAGVYLDHFAREGKRGGAWMDVCRTPLLEDDGTAPADRLPDLQLQPGQRRQALAADPRRSADPVPRIRARPAPPADRSALAQRRRHQRRGVGCGRAAEPVHGELRLAARGAGSVSPGTAQTDEPLPQALVRADAGGAAFPRRPVPDAPARVRAVRFPPAPRVRSGARRAHAGTAR